MQTNSKSMEELLKEIQHLKQEVEKYKTLAESKSNVGRKAKFNQEQILEIKEANKQGKSIRTLAREYNCSVGLIHKVLNEK